MQCVNTWFAAVYWSLTVKLLLHIDVLLKDGILLLLFQKLTLLTHLLLVLGAELGCFLPQLSLLIELIFDDIGSFLPDHVLGIGLSSDLVVCTQLHLLGLLHFDGSRCSLFTSLLVGIV